MAVSVDESNNKSGRKVMSVIIYYCNENLELFSKCIGLPEVHE